MARIQTELEQLKGLRWCFIADSANSIFVGFTFAGPQFVLFLDFLGVSKLGIGALFSLLPLLGLSALVTLPTISRFGYKRTFLLFYFARKLIMAALLCTPLVIAALGSPIGFVFVGCVLAAFGLCRAVSETALYPWSMEYIPLAVRGRFSAVDGILCSLSSLVATLTAGYVLNEFDDVTPFMILIVIGVMFGFVSVVAYSQIPGGAPAWASNQGRAEYFNFALALENRKMQRFLVGNSLMLSVLAPMPVLTPLFYLNQVGLTSSQTVWSSTAMFAGGLFAMFGWGYLADRFGGRPIMLWGVVLCCVLPLGWLCLPLQSATGFYLVLVMEALHGAVIPAWSIGSAHYLFVNIIPGSEKGTMTALFYAGSGISSGISLLLSGWILDYLSKIAPLTIARISIGLYTPFFVYMFGAAIVCFVILSKRNPDLSLVKGC